MGPIVHDVNVFNMPFVFRDEAHMREGDRRPDRRRAAREDHRPPRRGSSALGWMDAGARNVYGKKPVPTPADLKGQKIRMMGNPLFVETMNAMGGSGVSMGFGELYHRAPDRRRRRRREQPADAAGAEPLPAARKSTRRPATSSFPRSSSCRSAPGTALARRPGAGQEALARGAVRAAEALGREDVDGRGRAQGQRRRVHRRRQPPFYDATAAGARQVRRQVRRPDQAHRSRRSSAPR